MIELTDFQQVMLTDATVSAGVRAGLSLEDIIVILAKEKVDLMELVKRLNAIAPFKINTPDGMLVWRCPDEFVPERGV